MVGSREIMRGIVGVRHCRSAPASKRRPQPGARSALVAPAPARARTARCAARRSACAASATACLSGSSASSTRSVRVGWSRPAHRAQALAARSACSTSDELAARAVGVGGQPGRQLGRRQRDHGLELLGQLAAERDACAPGIAAASASARPSMRCGASNSTSASPRRCASSAPAHASRSPALAGRKPTKAKPVALRCRRPRSARPARCWRRAIGTRARSPAARAAATSAAPGSRHRRRAGVADVGHALAARQPREHLRRGARARCAGAPPAAAWPGRGGASSAPLTRVSSQATASTSAEHVHRAQRQVGQVADRRGHHVQRAGGILLRAGGRGSGLGDDRGSSDGGGDDGLPP